MYCCWQWSCLYCGYARNWPHNSQALFSPSHQYRSTDVRSQHCSSHVPRPTVRDMESARTLSAAATAKSLQSCPTLCDPIDGSPPGSPVPGILQARTRVGCHFLLQCMKVKGKVKSLSRVQLFATPWTAAYQAPPSMGFSRQEYWSGVPLPSPEISSC